MDCYRVSFIKKNGRQIVRFWKCLIFGAQKPHVGQVAKIWNFYSSKYFLCTLKPYKIYFVTQRGWRVMKPTKPLKTPFLLTVNNVSKKFTACIFSDNNVGLLYKIFWYVYNEIAYILDSLLLKVWLIHTNSCLNTKVNRHAWTWMFA